MLSSDCTVDMIYLDFSKAFDKVDHGILLHKLKDLGITGKLGIWFFQFLTNRTHYVRLPGGLSQNSPVLSGVPQGTVLGPLLFLIMISDINKEITSSKVISFADDTRVYSNITQADDCDNLQSDLNTIYNWALYNNMFFNSQKFHYVSYSSSLSSNVTNVYVNPDLEIINPTNNVLDLGIFMSGDCSFEFHIKNVCKKCTNLSGWILRTFSTRDITTMLTLFKSLVLSRLDYASQLWSPHLVKHIDQLEKIQRSFTKHITGMQGLDYSDRLVVVVYPLPWPLLVGGVRCSRLWSTSQLLRPSGQQCSHSGGVCPQIQGRQCGAYVGAVEEMMWVVCVDVIEGA